MRRLRVAVIGAGHLGRIHARILRSSDAAECVGVADPSEECRQWVQSELGLPVYENHRAVCDIVDAAIIATPTNVHYDIAIDFLNHGIHTLIEKPITNTVEQADHLIHTADQQQLVLQVGHVERFNPAFEIANQSLPQPRYLEAHRMSGYTFRSIDVGVVHDLMIHDIDLLASMITSPLLDVRAIGIAVFGPHEDIAQARLEFSNGSIANLTASRCSFQPVRQISWFNENGFVSADLGDQTVSRVQCPEILKSNDRDIQSLNEQRQQQIKDHLFQEVLPKTQLHVNPHNAIEMEHVDFFAAIQKNALPRVTGRHGRRAISIAQAIIDSIRAHRWTDGHTTRVGHQAARLNLLPTIAGGGEQKKAG